MGLKGKNDKTRHISKIYLLNVFNENYIWKKYIYIIYASFKEYICYTKFHLFDILGIGKL